MQQHITKAELGKLALRAAISIERSQLNKPVDLSAVGRFLDALDSEIDDSESVAVLKDETLFPYYSSALAKADDLEPLTRNQFSAAFRGALDRHKHAAEQGDGLEKIKQFSLAFHEAILRAIQQNTFGNDRIDGRIR